MQLMHVMTLRRDSFALISLRRISKPRRRLTTALALTSLTFTLAPPAHAGAELDISPIPTCAADFDGDGDVNAADLANMLTQWSLPPGTPGCAGGIVCPADLNGDDLVNAADLARLLGAWGDCPTVCSGDFADMVFSNETISVDVFFASFEVTLDGTLAVDEFGTINGSLTATFEDGSSVAITVTRDSLTATTGGSIDFLSTIPDAGPLLMVEGATVSGASVMDAFLDDAMSGSPMSWSPGSRFTLAMLALGSSDQLHCHLFAELARSGDNEANNPSLGCKIAAYSAATLIAAAAGASCAVLTAACVPGTAVTFGGLAVPCTALIGLCAGGAFAGTAAAYEVTLGLWQE